MRAGEQEQIRQWLVEFAQSGSELAFRELVGRYVDFVHSAALRLVHCDTQLAEDVTQTVFTDLARQARRLPSEVMLGGWLHRHTCFVASKTLRTERRRHAREREAMAMQTQEEHSTDNLERIAPVLDEAINELGAEDRTAIVLRFFESQDFKSIGSALGTNQDAARKRVDRAISKLHSLLSARGISLSASALAASMAHSLVQAAPAGMAASAASLALAGNAANSIGLLELILMSKAKSAIVGAAALALAITPLYWQHRANSMLKAENQSLRERWERDSALWKEEAARLSNRLAQAAIPKTTNTAAELLRLRGEVGRLTTESAKAAADARSRPSVMSDMTANPETRKIIRAQQKMGMAMIYSGFTKALSLNKEQAEQFHELLADHVMSNVDHITTVLKERLSKEQAGALFDVEENAFKDKVRQMLGPEALTKLETFNQELGSRLTADQFKPMLTGDNDRKGDVTQRLFELMKTETSQVLAARGLPADFQVVPSLNFQNFPSETEAEKNLNLLKSIYDQVSAKASGLLSAEELAKFAEFSATAIANNRAALEMNRKMMAPPPAP